jgi:hypothetical protein
MIENLIVALIVAVAALSVAAKYVPASWRRQALYQLDRRGLAPAPVVRWLGTKSSCGSGCDSCKACADPADSAPAPGARRVIKLHVRR